VSASFGKAASSIVQPLEEPLHSHVAILLAGFFSHGNRKIAWREVRGVWGMLKHSDVFREKSVVVSHCLSTKSTVQMPTAQDDVEVPYTYAYGDVKFFIESLPLWNKFVMNNTPGIK
jgi:hypothetical protein